jgi:Flp pilus assembly protein TadD
MSLINQMLRDLEGRQATSSAAFEAALQTPVVMAQPGNGDRRKLKYTLLAGTGVVCLVLLAWAWLTVGSGSPGVTARSPVGTASDSGHITRPLSLPVATGDSITPVEQPALQTPSASPATTAKPLAPAISEPQAQALPVATSPRGTAKATLAAQTEEAAAPDTAGEVTSRPIPVTRAQTARAASEKAASRPSGPRHIEISERPLTLSQQAQRRYTEAVKVLRAGDTGTSVQQLEQVLALKPGHHPARLLLASLHINRQRKQQAEIVLAEGLTLDPGHAPFAKLHAQLLIEQAREQEALQSLQSALPGAGQDAEYHALMAGLYRHGGNPVKAAGHYRSALQLAPGHGEWWMGLGLSLEQAGHSAEAYAAYGQALKRPLSAALQNYVWTRMQRLSPDTGRGGSPGGPDR